MYFVPPLPGIGHLPGKRTPAEARNAEKTLISLAINRKEPIFASKFNGCKIYGHKKNDWCMIKFYDRKSEMSQLLDVQKQAFED